MNKTKITIAALLTAVLSIAANAAPYSATNPTIALPINGVGTYSLTDGGANAKILYTVSYDSPFGGHWLLNGTHTEPGFHHNQRYFEDSFAGTVSNTSLNGTFGPSDFTWIGDVWLYCLPPRGRQFAMPVFTITISGGRVQGTARINQ